MNAEDILRKILLEIGIDKPTPQLSGTDYETTQIKNFINEAGDEIARRAEWSRLYKEWIVPGRTSEIDLPEDFLKIAQDGAVRVNKSTYGAIRGISAPQQWQMIRTRPSRQGFYHLSEGKIMFSPMLDDDGAIVRYVSKNWTVGKREIEQNGDQVLIPARLIVKGSVWRWKRQKGLQFEDALAEFEATLVSEIKADRGED